MNQCRNQNRPNTSLWSGVWNHNTYLAGMRKVIKLKRKYQVFNPSGGCHSLLGISLQNNLREQEVSKSQCLPRKSSLHPLQPLCTILALARAARTLGPRFRNLYGTLPPDPLVTHHTWEESTGLRDMRVHQDLVLLLINGSVDNRDAEITCPS